MQKSKSPIGLREAGIIAGTIFLAGCGGISGINHRGDPYAVNLGPGSTRIYKNEQTGEISAGTGDRIIGPPIPFIRHSRPSRKCHNPNYRGPHSGWP